MLYLYQILVLITFLACVPSGNKLNKKSKKQSDLEKTQEEIHAQGLGVNNNQHIKENKGPKEFIPTKILPSNEIDKLPEATVSINKTTRVNIYNYKKEKLEDTPDLLFLRQWGWIIKNITIFPIQFLSMQEIYLYINLMTW